MARTRKPNAHDFRRGELVMVMANVPPLELGAIVQVVGFRGVTHLRLLPIGGLPVTVHYELVGRTSLPAGSERPPHRRRFQRRPRRQKTAAAA